jgi:hypothetical protein
MSLPDVKKPVCERCGDREAVTVCGTHGVFLCGPCSSMHSRPDCVWHAAPAAFLVASDQLPLPLGVEGVDR